MLPNPVKTEQLKIYAKASEFIKSCERFLCEREAENNLILGIGGVLGTPASPYKDFYLASVGNTQIKGVFMMTPPHKLIISSPASEEAIDAVIQEAVLGKRAISGVNGPSEAAVKFAEIWTKRTGDESKRTTTIFCYKLSAVKDIPRSNGQIRRASLADLDTMVRWARGFDADANINHNEDESQIRIKLTHGINGGHFYIWEDGKPVSMARASGDTPNGIRISFVYTPPEYRGRGYASSLVADVSQIKLDEGKKFCFLFTDAANPTSNNIYKNIGYGKVCEFSEYSFVKN